MNKSKIIQGIITIVIAALTAALSFFFASCSTSSHLELKHSNDSLIIRQDKQGTITKTGNSHIAIPLSPKTQNSFYYVKF